MPRVVHFEIHATEPERVVGFYTTLFGWSIRKMPSMEYWLIESGPADKPGINGGLLPRRGPPPESGQAVNGFVCTVEVDSLDAMMDKTPLLGGSIALPKMAIPGVGWLGYIKDPDGNILGMMQPDLKAV